ncbi:hypothetical protein QBC44DRAFT_391536 [Cladorrhinum sp. PSN332]|nr:hypothetical protein QBC44DRAFT_391536 [Cladorrhinum sp. PSN332]
MDLDLFISRKDMVKRTEPATISDECPLDLAPDPIAFVRDALQTCLSHPLHDCDPQPGPRLPEKWPKRILAITEVITSVEFGRQRLPGNYAALSYCWGGLDELERHPPLEATSTTLPDLKAGISVSKLPATLRQAVKVCQHLGIEYIWIDSLCTI